VTDKLMVITEHGDRDQIAVLEEDVLVQHYVTRAGATSMVGNIYLGRVQNVLPGMEAAFVDVGSWSQRRPCTRARSTIRRKTSREPHRASSSS
jgi:Ribonuclease G/E